MKMVERMARAMEDSEAWPMGAELGAARSLALAALKAMREPSEEIAIDGADIGNLYSDAGVSTLAVAAIFTAMIDTAIKEAEAG